MKPATEVVLEAILTGDETVTASQIKRVMTLLTGKVETTKLLTTKETYTRLGCSRATLFRLIKLGQLTPIYYSRRKVRFREEDVESFRLNGVSYHTPVSQGQTGPEKHL